MYALGDKLSSCLALSLVCLLIALLSFHRSFCTWKTNMVGYNIYNGHREEQRLLFVLANALHVIKVLPKLK